MKITHLIYDADKKYWYCENCGAIYHQSENWEPYANYCMKCKTEWYGSEGEN